MVPGPPPLRSDDACLGSGAGGGRSRGLLPRRRTDAREFLSSHLSSRRRVAAPDRRARTRRGTGLASGEYGCVLLQASLSIFLADRPAAIRPDPADRPPPGRLDGRAREAGPRLARAR